MSRSASATGTDAAPRQQAWNPPADLVTPLDEGWRHVEDTYDDPYGFTNYGWDCEATQIMANGGSINYCVRWDSDQPVPAELRDRIHQTLERQFTAWMDVLVADGQGWNGWPYTEVDVNVVGWAVRDRGTLQWDDDSVDIYVGDIAEDAPQCAPECGRFFDQDGDYSDCPGGEARHDDMSLWLTAGMGGGAGGDWGQTDGQRVLRGPTTGHRPEWTASR